MFGDGAITASGSAHEALQVRFSEVRWNLSSYKRYCVGAIERMFCRLKDYRRIATRYDKLATNFLSAICLAAVVTWWL